MRAACLQFALSVLFVFSRAIFAIAVEPPQGSANDSLNGSLAPSETLNQPAEAASSTPAIHSERSTVSVHELSIPEGARKEFEKGRRLLVDEHKAQKSLAPLHKAIQIAPAYWQAHLLLGVAYMDLQKWSDAEPPLRSAIAANERLGAAYLALGSCLLEEDKYLEAEQQLLEGLNLNPDAAHGHYDLSRTYYALGQFEDARLQARKAVDLGPDDADVHFLLGSTLVRLGEKGGALAEFQQCLRLAPRAPLVAMAQEQVTRLQSEQASAR